MDAYRSIQPIKSRRIFQNHISRTKRRTRNIICDIIKRVLAGEIIHLQDVAHLINHVHHLGIGLLLVFAALYLNHLMAMRRYGNLINSHSQLIIVAALACLIALIFFIVGAKSIFYQMHILIFPADHQWFFYYQDSLMSTLMKAPDLFAGIAVQILFIAILLFALGLWAHHGLKRTVEAQD